MVVNHIPSLTLKKEKLNLCLQEVFLGLSKMQIRMLPGLLYSTCIYANQSSFPVTSLNNNFGMNMAVSKGSASLITAVCLFLYRMIFFLLVNVFIPKAHSQR